jgi:hypothetical protein
VIQAEIRRFASLILQLAYSLGELGPFRQEGFLQRQQRFPRVNNNLILDNDEAEPLLPVNKQWSQQVPSGFVILMIRLGTQRPHVQPNPALSSARVTLPASTGKALFSSGFALGLLSPTSQSDVPGASKFVASENSTPAGSCRIESQQWHGSKAQ